MARIAWGGALVLLAVAGVVASQRVHGFGVEGPGFSVLGGVPWAVLASVPLLLVAVLVRRRARTSLTLIAVAALVLVVALLLEWTGLGWLMGLRGQ